jgi:hypothetical protein
MKAFLTVVVACLGLAVAPAFAGIQLITNGGFETGDLTGWSTLGTAGSDDLFTADNTGITPLNGFPTVGPDSGSWYAVSDMTGLVTPESSYLTQTVTIPFGTTDDLLAFDIFVNDVFGGSGTGGEVAIWANGANPLTASPLSVVYGPSDTAVSNGNPNPWLPQSIDVTSSLTPGSSYLIGVLESDSTGPINVGVDNFSLMATVATTTPEPGTLFPSALLLAGLFVYLVRRKAGAQA